MKEVFTDKIKYRYSHQGRILILDTPSKSLPWRYGGREKATKALLQSSSVMYKSGAEWLADRLCSASFHTSVMKSEDRVAEVRCNTVSIERPIQLPPAGGQPSQ